MMPEADRPRSLALPMLIVAGVFVASLLVTTLQLVSDREALAVTTRLQARATLDGDRLRQQLEALLAGTTDLARGGNAAAKAVLDGLAKQGVTYNPPK